MTHRKRNAALAAVGALIAILSVAPAAFADNFAGGPPNAGYRADNPGHDYCTIAAWPLDWGTPFVDAMISLDNQTDMYDTYSSSCGSQTDVQGERSSNAYMPGIRGSYMCLTFVAAGVCDTARLQMNVDLLTDYTQRRKTFCHEVGHSVGLEHYTSAGSRVVAGENNDCMKNGTVSGELWWKEYSQHHRDHINQAY